MIIAINFADKAYSNAQKANTKSAYKKGKVDRVIEYSPKDIDHEFYEENKTILSVKRGAGLWLWKPYFILKTLQQMNANEYLIYADSGSCYRKNVRYLTDALEARNQSVLCFDLGGVI